MPFLDTLLGTATAAVMSLLMLITLLLIWFRVIGNKKYFVVAVSLAFLVGRTVGPADDFYHFSVLLGLAALHFSVLGFMILAIMRYNLLSYVCVSWLGLIFSGMNAVDSDLLFYQVNGALMLAFGLLPLAMAFLASRNLGKGNE